MLFKARVVIAPNVLMFIVYDWPREPYVNTKIHYETDHFRVLQRNVLEVSRGSLFLPGLEDGMQSFNPRSQSRYMHPQDMDNWVKEYSEAHRVLNGCEPTIIDLRTYGLEMETL